MVLDSVGLYYGTEDTSPQIDLHEAEAEAGRPVELNFFLALKLFTVSECKCVVVIEYPISSCEMEQKPTSPTLFW